MSPQALLRAGPGAGSPSGLQSSSGGEQVCFPAGLSFSPLPPSSLWNPCSAPHIWGLGRLKPCSRKRVPGLSAHKQASSAAWGGLSRLLPAATHPPSYRLRAWIPAPFQAFQAAPLLFLKQSSLQERISLQKKIIDHFKQQFNSWTGKVRHQKPKAAQHVCETAW